MEPIIEHYFTRVDLRVYVDKIIHNSRNSEKANCTKSRVKRTRKSFLGMVDEPSSSVSVEKQESSLTSF